MSKNCVFASSRGLCVGKGIAHAHAVDRVLLEAVDHARRGDFELLVDRRDDVDDMVELRTRRRVGLDLRRPRDGHRLACAAEVSADELGGPVRSAAGPGPSGVIHVVGLWATERIEAAEFLQRLDVLRNLGRNSVLRQLLADGAVQTFGMRNRCRPRCRRSACCRVCPAARSRR